jgi:hypothetical protein
MRTKFSAVVQTGPEAHPAFFTMFRVSFPGMRRPGRGIDHPTHLAPKVNKELSYTATPLCVFIP